MNMTQDSQKRDLIGSSDGAADAAKQSGASPSMYIPSGSSHAASTVQNPSTPSRVRQSLTGTAAQPNQSPVATPTQSTSPAHQPPTKQGFSLSSQQKFLLVALGVVLVAGSMVAYLLWPASPSSQLSNEVPMQSEEGNLVANPQEPEFEEYVALLEGEFDASSRAQMFEYLLGNGIGYFFDAREFPILTEVIFTYDSEIDTTTIFARLEDTESEYALWAEVAENVYYEPVYSEIEGDHSYLTLQFEGKDEQFQKILITRVETEEDRILPLGDVMYERELASNE